MSSSPASHPITLVEWSNTFVPFGLLLVAALLVPELSDGVIHGRIVFSIWLTTALLIPEMWLYFVEGPLGRRVNYARLLWTFGYLTYLVHFYYAVFIHFGGIPATFEGMQRPLAAINFILTGCWTIDVLLLWIFPPQLLWLRLERLAVHLFILFVFVVTEVVLMSGFVRWLGIALGLSALLGLLGRVFRLARGQAGLA
jgi:hypothetical protein